MSVLGQMSGWDKHACAYHTVEAWLFKVCLHTCGVRLLHLVARLAGHSDVLFGCYWPKAPDLGI